MDSTFPIDLNRLAGALTERLAIWWAELSEETKTKLRDLLVFTAASLVVSGIAAFSIGRVPTILVTAAYGSLVEPLVVQGLNNLIL